MTLGEKLLNLTVEYQESQTSRGGEDGAPCGARSAGDIAAEYESVVLELVASR